MSQSLFPFTTTGDIRYYNSENRTTAIIPYSSLRIGMPCMLDVRSMSILLPLQTMFFLKKPREGLSLHE